MPHLREFRFDPRLVKVALVMLGIGTIIGFALFGVAANQRDDIARPVAALCEQGGPTGAQLADHGACQAAGNTSVGPFQSEVVSGPPGGRGPGGVPGQPGADSQIPGPGGAPGLPGADSTVPGSPGKAGEPGTSIPGANGTNGADGVSPACLSEPGACRGAEGSPGKPGEPGSPGAPGADGRGVAGTQVVDCHLIVTYTDGSSEDAGQVCTPDPEPDMP